MTGFGQGFKDFAFLDKFDKRIRKALREYAKKIKNENIEKAIIADELAKVIVVIVTKKLDDFSFLDSYEYLNQYLNKKPIDAETLVMVANLFATTELRKPRSKGGKRRAEKDEAHIKMNNVVGEYLKRWASGSRFPHGLLAKFYEEMAQKHSLDFASIKNRIEKVRKESGHTKLKKQYS